MTGAASNGSAAATTAGAMLRQAREAQGLHIAALATALKVPPRKLELLESDRCDELPDPTFARALAQTVCRALKIDSAPVLALLPRADAGALEHVAAGLNTPFRDPVHDGRFDARALLRHPAAWLVALLLLAALAVASWPAGGLWLPALKPPASQAEAPPQPQPLPAAPEPMLAPVPIAPASAAASSSAAAASAASPVPSAAGPEVDAAAPVALPASSVLPVRSGTIDRLAIRARAASWVEVRSADSSLLLSRTVQPGETIALDGVAPLQLTIGNAAATEVAFRGQPVDLTPLTIGNVARFTLPPTLP